MFDETAIANHIFADIGLKGNDYDTRIQYDKCVF